jgi:hypothetical protein
MGATYVRAPTKRGVVLTVVRHDPVKRLSEYFPV